MPKFFFFIAVVSFVFKENVLLQQVLNRLYDLGRDVCGILGHFYNCNSYS